MGVVPIVNENDTVSVSEIQFGDNDTLSAITSSMIRADYLFLLTDVDGLYTSNPRKDPSAKQIEVVTSIPAIRSQVSTATLEYSLGTGGMETKLIAAEIATGAGVTTIITSSKVPENIFAIIEYHNSTKSASIPGTPSDSISGRTSPSHEQRDPRAEASDSNGFMAPTPIRPPHTVFIASPAPMRDLKSWTSHTLSPSGSVVIDNGAHRILSQRESGGRLLAAGVVDVIGVFASGQAVRIVIRKTSALSTTDGNENGNDAQASYGKSNGVTRSSSTTTTPPLSRPTSSAGIVSLIDPKTLPEEDLVLLDRKQLSEDDVVEVGRGLANYNSAHILRVRGLNSSQIPPMLGYADSEYVVENITIRVPPTS